MKYMLHGFTLMMALTSLDTSARVIYGEDNRMEVSEAPEHLQVLARSAATMISSLKMSVDPARPNLTQVEQSTLSDWLTSVTSGEDKSPKLFTPKFIKANKAPLNFCPGERFVDQPNAGMCSGFLIAPDLLVTAGHCVELATFCSEYKWVFDYKVDPVTFQAGVDVPNENIYSCKKMISGSLSMDLGLDYGLVQLDRPVTGRKPLKINKNKTKDDAKLVLIGSPSGLPLKVAPGGVVRNNTHPFYFTSNTDSYQGNSGSAVFNEKTGEVEGILVRGEEDFVGNPLLKCVQSNRCTSDSCRGEDISRMTSIPEIGLQDALVQAIQLGDLESLNDILELGIWVDFNGADGKTALIVAAEAGQTEAMRVLIDAGADASHRDAQGKTAADYLQERK